MRVFRPTKQKGLKGIKFYGFDIETYGQKNVFYMGSVYSLSDGKAYVFYDKKEMLDFFKNKALFEKSYICATNLGFDFFGIFNKTDEMQKFDMIWRGSDLLSVSSRIKDGSFMDRHEYKRHRQDKKSNSIGKITFIDTFNYAKMSVEKLGGILGLPKLERPACLGRLPENEQERKELETYNIRDSEISVKFIKFLMDGFEELGASPKLTIASTAMSLFRNKYLDRPTIQPSSDVLLDHFRCYYGGRTEAFCRGLIENYNYYDVNSLYPDVMREPVPDYNSLRITYKDTLDYILQYEGMSDVDIVCPDMRYPLLPVKSEGKLIFPIGSWRGCYTHIELREALRLGYKINKVYKTNYFKRTFSPFKAYVEELYSLRKQYKSDNSSMELIVKLLMNSLYGKFAQRFEHCDNLMPFNHTKEELSKLKSFERIGEFIRITEDRMPSIFCMPMWSAYITARSRIKMHGIISMCEPVYMDTDSVITRHKLPESMELGALKLEMHIDKGIIVKPKFYAVLSERKEHIKIKGIGRRMKYTEFMQLFNDNRITFDKFVKFRESIRRKDKDVNEIISVIKELTLDDDKRSWHGDISPDRLVSSHPITLRDGVREDTLRRISEKMQKAIEKERIKSIMLSDHFDLESVADDISVSEFIENEQFFALHD